MRTALHGALGRQTAMAVTQTQPASTSPGQLRLTLLPGLTPTYSTFALPPLIQDQWFQGP